MPTLRIDNKNIEVKRLANGAFSRVYQGVENGIIYALVEDNSGDYTKEAIADWTDHNNPHIPQIKRESINNSLSSLPYLDFYVFSMPHYGVTKGEARKTARQLIDLWWEFMARNPIRNHNAEWLFYDRCDAFLNTLEGDFSDTLIDALESILGAMTNYSQAVNWDFKMDNFKMDNEGNLILLDVIFDITARQGLS